uniref:Uncharacterized protein n=2 Tax=Hemiselmis andersenii TaxID=464988 RepID=A0A7S1HLD1_HEMAN
MAEGSYQYAVDLGTTRWGAKHPRTVELSEALAECRRGKVLGQYDIDMARKFYGTKTRKPGSKKGPQRARLRVLPAYAESTSPVGRAAEKRPGWYSPRFWSSKDGMNPRRMSPYNKDIVQIGLEMSKTLSPAVFPSVASKEPWGECREPWRDTGDVDLAPIDGSVPSRSRLFSDISTNTKLSALAEVTDKRLGISSRYPTNFSVYKKALEIRGAMREVTKPKSEDAFLAGTFLLKPVRLHGMTASKVETSYAQRPEASSPNPSSPSGSVI